jgi:hypothetical protein
MTVACIFFDVLFYIFIIYFFQTLCHRAFDAATGKKKPRCLIAGPYDEVVFL